MSTRLNSLVAVVTGGAAGLGRAIATRLAADGATVMITDINRDLGTQVAAFNGWGFCEHDVCDESSWQGVLQTAQARLGSVHILVNNAGILGPRDCANPVNTRLADWKRVMSVNVDGVFLGCKTMIPLMAQSGGGTIINVASIAGLRATPYATAYGASKAAVRQLTKSVAQHCALEDLRIRCNSVHPGDVATAQWEEHVGHIAARDNIPLTEAIEDVRLSIPLRSITHPEDVAAMVAFLASEDAQQITGAMFVVDGGVANCETYARAARSRAPSLARDDDQGS